MFGAVSQGGQRRRDRRLQQHPARRIRQGHHGTGAARRQVARLRLARHRNRRPQHSGAAEGIRRSRSHQGQAHRASSRTRSKGKGVSFMENNPKFHGVAPTQRTKSRTGAAGACIMPRSNDEIRIETRRRHARGLRQGAGRAGPREQGRRRLRRRSFQVHHDTAYFAKEFPDRFFECGIAEANMVAIGAGLACGGQDSVRVQLLRVRDEQGLRAAARDGRLSAT